jgi:glycosyltransferase involved in cell wall biosynthesis
MAAAMTRLADSPELVARLGAQARAFSSAFTWDRAADQTEEHLRRAVGTGT